MRWMPTMPANGATTRRSSGWSAPSPPVCRARWRQRREVGDAWRVKWVDGSESAQVCFDARTAEQNPDLEWVTLEDPRARAVISELPRFVAGQPLPVVKRDRPA
jgi:hypothetical protein